MNTELTLDVTGPIRGLNQLSDSARKLHDLLRQTAEEGTRSFQAFAQANIDAKNRILEQSKAIRETQDFIRELTTRYRELQQQQKAAQQASRAAAPGEDTLKANRALEDYQRRLQQVRQTIQQYQGVLAQQKLVQAEVTEAVRQETNARKLEAAATKDSITAAKQKTQADKEAAAAQKAAGASSGKETGGGFLSTLTGGGGLLGSILSKAVPTVAALSLVSTAIDKVKEGINSYADLSELQNTFKALTGSATAGAQEFAYVKEQARAYGVELLPIAKAYSAIYVAGKEANLTTAETRAIFQAITAETKVLGKSDAELEAALRAVTQMLSKGKVSAEELRGQLGDALPDATSKAAKALGVSTAELDKMLQKGQIVARDFLPKFAAELQKSYGDGSATAATQLRSNLSRINTFIDESTARIGAAVAPVIKYVADLVGAPAKLSESTKQELVDLEITSQRLRETNIGQKERVELIQQLQQQYPQYLGNLKAETATNEQLATAIDKVSESLVNRIVLQREDEKIAEQAQKTADKRQQAIEAELDLRKRLNEVEKQNAQQRASGSTFQTPSGDQKPVLDLKAYNTGKSLTDATQQTLEYTAAGLTGLSQYNQAYERLYQASVRYQQAQAALRAEQSKSNGLEQHKLEILRALGLEQTHATATTSAGTTAEQGYIEQLRERIKTETELREKINNNAQTKENTNGGGQARRDALTADINATQKKLDEALGKQDKAAVTAENKLAAALKALQEKKRALRQEYDKAVLEDLKSNGRAVAEEELKQRLASIKRMEEDIIAKENLVKKRGGKGENADGKLNAEQQAESNKLVTLEYQKYLDTLSELDRQSTARLLDLQKDSDQKELGQLQLKFDDALRIARDAHNDQEVEALQAARRQQVAVLKQRQALADIDYRQRLTEQTIATSAPLQPQVNTQPDVTADQSNGPEVQALTKRNKLVELLERARYNIQDENQKRLLRAQIEFNRERLVAIQADFSKEGIEQRKFLEDSTKSAEDALDKLTNAKPKFDFLKLLGVADEDRDDVQNAFDELGNQVVNALDSINAANLKAAQERVSAASQTIDDLKSQLGAEIELHKAGSASNIATIQAEIKEQKRIRQQALKDQKAEQRAQLAVDTALQASNIFTASSNIFKGTSKLDAVLPGLGIATGVTLTALLVGAFAASKLKALQAINNESTGSYFKGGLAQNVSTKGGYTGNGNPHEESRALGDKSYTYHKKEFVMSHQVTEKHINFFEHLHQDKLHKLSWQDPTLLQIKAQVEPDPELPKRIIEQREQILLIQREQTSIEPLKLELAETNRKLDEAIKQLKFMPKETVTSVEGDDETLVLTNNKETNTRTTTRYPKRKSQ